jgi:hypothetical protein
MSLGRRRAPIRMSSICFSYTALAVDDATKVRPSTNLILVRADDRGQRYAGCMPAQPAGQCSASTSSRIELAA